MKSSAGQSNLDLFQTESISEHGQPTALALKDADIEFYECFFSKAQSDLYFEILRSQVAWKQETIKYYGKLIDLPRLTAWYGDPGKNYKYSGIVVDSQPWIAPLLSIKQEIESASGALFNSVLLNLYRNERDSVAWHSDDEPELGTSPTIASLSLGATRTFQLRHKRDDSQRSKIDLSHGSLLLMKGSMQHSWQHQISKTTRSSGPRINLTFRKIL